ncbi:MAG: TRAP transporter small permease [Eubacteriales bacterium]|jgi:TRAP-type C4-dicarboxylate transport system permease small subunit
MKKNPILNILFKLDYFVASACFLVLVGITILGVVMRYVVGQPFQWLEEVSTSLFVWMALMGAACAVRTGGHVSIDMVVDFFPPKARKVADIFVFVIFMIVLGCMIYYGTLISIDYSGKVTALLKVPYRYINMAVPVGAALMMISEVVIFIQKMTGKVAYDDRTGKVEATPNELPEEKEGVA